jgi:hypothetical protein
LLAEAGRDQSAPGLRRALGAIDRLRDAVRGSDPRAFPEGFLDRLASARLDLNLGDPEGASSALGALRAELTLS